MNKPRFIKTIASLLSLTLIFLSLSCSQSSVMLPNTNTPQTISTLSDPLIVNLLGTDNNMLWSETFNHYEKGLLKKVAKSIEELAVAADINNQRLDKLSYYLRIFSSFGPENNWQAGSEVSLNNALIALTAMPSFYQITPSAARLHENYAVALYRLYFLESMQPLVTDHITVLSQLINLYSTDALIDDVSVDYAMWEILRAAAILPYEARRKNEAAFTAAVQGNGDLESALVNFISAPNAIRKGDNWPKSNASWALANIYNLYNKQYWNAYYAYSLDEQILIDKGKLSLSYTEKMKQLDAQVWQALKSDSTTPLTQVKQQYSVPYLVSSFRGKSACEEKALKGKCYLPTLEEALPIKHTCSSSLYILAQSMSQEELETSCETLLSQEDFFHQTLATHRQPVANDFNDKLRVVIFDDAAQYNLYGQLTFDINTDNGGMYIEGTPQNPNNIATFYSFEHFWIRPEFGVWNLNHEYVHYLDGRFVKYDTFNHFPSHLVWWTEGLAEYVSKVDANEAAFKIVAEKDESHWPTLSEVFSTEYKDGTERVYQWSYLAVRFMVEHHPNQYRKMAHFLKTDYFDGYKKLLDVAGEEHSKEFVQWLSTHKAQFTASASEQEQRKPRQLYRYTYKNYLKPKYLVEDENHMIWQYWHANAIKIKE